MRFSPSSLSPDKKINSNINYLQLFKILNIVFTRKNCKMTSQSVLKGCEIFRLSNILWQIIPLIDYARKKGMFKTSQSCRCKLKFKTVICS